MQPLDDTTFVQNADQVQVVVGDATETDFYPRVKIEKWDNEANLSIGLDATPDGAIITQDGDTLVFEKDDITARFYPTFEDKKKLTGIRRVLKGDEITALASSSEYEMFNQIGKSDQMMIAHYVVTEPSISTFDLMPATEHLQVIEENGKIYVQDFDYADKSAYHPADIPIPSYDKVALTRFYTPYNTYINPYYMDAGLHNLDFNWKGSSFTTCLDQLMDSIEKVMTLHGVEVSAQLDLNGQLRKKLYFKHGDRWVKFFSAQEENQGLYAYINIASAYNKAYDFYRPDVEKDIRNDFAYGVAFAYPQITHAVVDEIIVDFAKRLKLPLSDTPYNVDEQAMWQNIQTLQDNHDWLVDAKRSDANYHFSRPEDGFEFEIDLAVRPDINEVSLTTNIPKNAIAYFQADIPFAEKVQKGDTRKPHATNSLAVYHTDKKNDQYQTGKIAHIYRPIAWDTTGHKVFCDFKGIETLLDGDEFDLSNGLTIVIPQDFLDNATYPVTVDPTFGYTTAGGSNTSMTDIVLATQQTMGGTAGNLGAIAFYSAIVATTAQYETAVYDSGGNYLYDSGNISYNAVIGWTASSFSAHPTLNASTDYRLAVYGDSGGGQGGTLSCAYDSTGGKTSYSFAQAYAVDTFPANMGSFTTESSRQYSIYAITGYQWSMMMGSSPAMAATTRNQPLVGGSATTWATTLDLQPIVNPVASVITDLRVNLTTAPGGATARAMGVTKNVTLGVLSASISGAATTATDSAGAILLDTGDTSQLVNTPTGSPASSTVNKWRMVDTNAYQIWRSTTVAAVSTTANRFLGVQDGAGVSTSAAAATQIMPGDTGVLQNFYARLVDNILTTGSYTITLVKNGTDTAAVMVLDSTNRAIAYTATTISVTDQDTLYYKIVPSAGTAPSSALRIAVSTEYVSNTAGRGVLFGGGNANVSGTTYSIWGNDVWNATEANISALAYIHTVVAMRATLSATPGAGNTRVLTYRKNAAGGTPAITISNPNTTGTWTGSYAIATDDLLALEHTSTGTPTNSNMKWGIVFDAPAVTPTSTFVGALALMGIG